MAETIRRPRGDFRILRAIGRGGMGVVYEAEEISLARRVALKLLPFASVLDPRQLARFRTEAQAAAILQHPHIVAVYGVGCERGVHYYAMQYIEGTTLAAAIDHLRQDASDAGKSQDVAEEDIGAENSEPGTDAASAPTAELAKLSTLHSTHDPDYFRSVARLGIQAAEALDHAHASGVLHRDIKPGNLMLDARGNLWITDFGLARIDAQAGLTLTGDLLGTPRSMSPEQVLGKRAAIDHRSDIYSLGATMYELLTLTPAVPGQDRQDVLNHIATDDPQHPGQINAAIPTDLSTIVQKTLAKAPEERYDTATELADDLRRFLNLQTIRAQPPTLRQRISKWGMRHKSFVAALTSTLLISTVALAIATILIARARTRAVNASQELKQVLDEKEIALREKATSLEQHQAALQREWETNQRNYPMNIAYANELLTNGSSEAAANILRLQIPGVGASDRRGFAWYYLWGLCQRRGQPVLGHKNPVDCVSFSPDSRLLATASGDHTVRLWDTETASLKGVLRGHTSDVNCVAFSPTGDTLTTASDDHTIGIWNTATGERLYTLHGHTDTVAFLAYSLDGAAIISSSANGELKKWDAVTGAELVSVQAHDGRIHSFSISADGSQLATCAADQAVKIWDLNSLNHLATFENPDQDDLDLQVVIYQPGTERLFAAFRHGGTIKVWDTRTGQLMSPKNAGIYVLGLAFSHDGQTLATPGGDGSLILWDLDDFHRQAVCSLGPFGRGSWCAAFSPDGRFLAAGDGEDATRIGTRQPPNYVRPASLEVGVACRAVAPDAQTVLVGCDDGSLRSFDLISGEEISHQHAHAEGVTSMQFSPDAALLATGGGDGLVWIRDPHTYRKHRSLSGFTDRIWDVAFSVDSRKLAACDGSQVKVWETNNWKPVDEWPIGGVDHVGFTFAGGVLVGGKVRPQIRETDKTVVPLAMGPHAERHLRAQGRALDGMALTRDGRKAAFAIHRFSNPARYDFSRYYETGINWGTDLVQHRNRQTIAVAFTSDGNTLGLKPAWLDLDFW